LQKRIQIPYIPQTRVREKILHQTSNQVVKQAHKSKIENSRKITKQTTTEQKLYTSFLTSNQSISTMTWSAFFAAIRRGASEKTAAASRRGGQRAAASTRAGVPKNVPPKPLPPLAEWNFMTMDEYGEPALLPL